MRKVTDEYSLSILPLRGAGRSVYDFLCLSQGCNVISVWIFFHAVNICICFVTPQSRVGDDLTGRGARWVDKRTTQTKWQPQLMLTFKPQQNFHIQYKYHNNEQKRSSWRSWDLERGRASQVSVCRSCFHLYSFCFSGFFTVFVQLNMDPNTMPSRKAGEPLTKLDAHLNFLEPY